MYGNNALQKWVGIEEPNPFKTGSDSEVFRGEKSGGTGFYLSIARRAVAVNVQQASGRIGTDVRVQLCCHNLMYLSLSIEIKSPEACVAPVALRVSCDRACHCVPCRKRDTSLCLQAASA